ncbi:rhodanese-like domain-containing protein [Paraburkholderia xenovorans]|uniref:sulfurtransferase n=1 Tax=Paraburkholderia xenovorans TaxID=36873 RepID=UPI0038B980C0
MNDSIRDPRDSGAGGANDDLRARMLIDPQALLQRLDDDTTVVLDAHVDLPSPRFDGDYRVTSGYDAWLAERIPGSRHADLIDALSAPHASLSFMRPTSDALADALSRLGVGEGARVVVYDRADGFWAARLWWLLRWIGIDAQVLDGGWQGWLAAGLPTQRGAASPVVARPLVARVREGLWAAREDVEAALAGRLSRTLVCALSEAAFSGRAPSRYARRGHIPGSVNLPARDLFDAQGRYLAQAELQTALASLDANTPVLLYCGGGISAAVDALALTLTGRTDVSVYDGSLQEWAADFTLPLEISD